MPRKGYRKTKFTFVERSEPDPQRAEEGLRMFAEMFVDAVIRDRVRAEMDRAARKLTGPNIEAKHKEESDDDVPKDRDPAD